jgi:hypothetical protein
MTTASKPRAEQTDLTELRPEFFRAGRVPQLVYLPAATYMAMDGKGEPETSLPDAIGAMYTVAYGLKFRLKRLGHDFKVCPVQAQWWFGSAANGAEPGTANADDWTWRLLLMVPDYVTPDDLRAVQQSARTTTPQVSRVSLIQLEEGPAVQVVHVGQYDAEAGTIAAMHEFMADQGLEAAGPHHEVYLGDPRRARPEKLRTLLRQRVRKIR